MTVLELVSALRRLGVQVERRGPDLVLRTAGVSLTPELEGALAEHRPELMLLIAPGRPGGKSSGETMRALSHNQRQIWFEHQLHPQASHYHIPAVISLGRGNVHAVAVAFSHVLRRHAGLRSRFPIAEDRPFVEIMPEQPPVALPMVDLDKAHDAGIEAAIRSVLRRPFDLEAGGLVRACLLRDRDGRMVLGMTLHHIVADGWSMGILVADFVAAYLAAAAGRPPRRTDGAAPASYADFARLQADAEGLHAFGPLVQMARDSLSDVPDLRLPLDYWRPELPTHRGGICTLQLPAGLVERVRAVAGECGVTPFAMFTAAYMAMLRHESGQDRFAIATDVAGREDETWDDVVGPFTNQVLLVAELPGSASGPEVVRRASEAIERACRLRALPFDLLVKALRSASGEHAPIFRAKIVMQPSLDDALASAGLTGIYVHDGRCKFDLLFTVSLSARGAGLAVEYSSDLFTERSGARFLASIVVVLEWLTAAQSSGPLDGLSKRLSAAGGRRIRRASRSAFRSRNEPHLVQ